MPALKSRVTCYTLKKYFENLPLWAFVELLPSCQLQINVNKNFEKHLQCFISQLVNSSLYSWQSYSWQSYSLTTRPQKYLTSAYIWLKMFVNNLNGRIIFLLKLTSAFRTSLAWWLLNDNYLFIFAFIFFLSICSAFQTQICFI